MISLENKRIVSFIRRLLWLHCGKHHIKCRNLKGTFDFIERFHVIPLKKSYDRKRGVMEPYDGEAEGRLIFPGTADKALPSETMQMKNRHVWNLENQWRPHQRLHYWHMQELHCIGGAAAATAQPELASKEGKGPKLTTSKQMGLKHTCWSCWLYTCNDQIWNKMLVSNRSWWTPNGQQAIFGPNC